MCNGGWDQGSHEERQRELTCTYKSTYEPVPWLRETERTAAAIKATRDSDDAEHKTEELLFKYNVVAVAAGALLLGCPGAALAAARVPRPRRAGSTSGRSVRTCV